MQRALWDGYRIEVPVERIGSLTVVRPSVQAYTTDDDCRALVDALAMILGVGLTATRMPAKASTRRTRCYGSGGKARAGKLCRAPQSCEFAIDEEAF